MKNSTLQPFFFRKIGKTGKTYCVSSSIEAKVVDSAKDSNPAGPLARPASKTLLGFALSLRQGNKSSVLPYFVNAAACSVANGNAGEPSRTAGTRPHRPHLWRSRKDLLSADILFCPILRISLSVRAPKRCSVVASPNLTELDGAEPENLALANNDDGHKSCATKKDCNPSVLTPQPQAKETKNDFCRARLLKILMLQDL